MPSAPFPGNPAGIMVVDREPHPGSMRPIARDTHPATWIESRQRRRVDGRWFMNRPDRPRGSGSMPVPSRMATTDGRDIGPDQLLPQSRPTRHRKAEEIVKTAHVPVSFSGVGTAQPADGIIIKPFELMLQKQKLIVTRAFWVPLTTRLPND